MEGEGKLRAPRRTHLESLARQGDPEAQAELAAASNIPPRAAYLWAYFHEISETRQINGMAISPLSRIEIRQWEEDEFVRLQPWERKAIRRLDAVFRSVMSRKDDED